MNLNLYDRDMNRISIIGNRFVSCYWAEGYNTVQPFTLELRETDEYRRKVRPDCYVGRDDRKTLMVIKTVQIKAGIIVASGFQAARVLDDSAFVGTIPSGSRIDSSIRDAYETCTKYHLVEFANGDLPDAYGGQISNKSILTLCTTMCQSGDVGFRAVRGQGKILVEFYKPAADPNLVFSEMFGNLLLKSLTMSNENLKNYAIVLGEGEGDERIRVDVDLSDGAARRELIVDARNIQMKKDESMDDYLLRLQSRGMEALLSKRQTWDCALTPIARDFGTRYDLGDILTVLLPEYGMKLQARVSKITQKTQGNKTDTTVEVGEITIMR